MRVVPVAVLFAVLFAGVACVPARRAPEPAFRLQDSVRAPGASAASTASKPEPAQTRERLSVPAGDPLADPSLEGAKGAAREVVAHVPGTVEPLRRAYAGRRPKRSFVGRATYYHDSLAGNFTACGDKYDPLAFTAAHRSLPFGTVLRVVNPRSGQDVFVCVNDRGPFGDRRLVLDLSRAAADRVGLLRVGVMKVRAEILELGDPKRGRCGR